MLPQMVDASPYTAVAQTNEAFPTRDAVAGVGWRKILGVLDKRVPFSSPYLVATMSASALLPRPATSAASFDSLARPGLHHSGRPLYEPKANTVAQRCGFNPDPCQQPSNSV